MLKQSEEFDTVMSNNEGQYPQVNWHGSVCGLYIAKTAGAPMTPLSEARLVIGRGIEGDRYFNGTGTHCEDDETWYEVTLIESETINTLRREKKALRNLEQGMPRRNIITEGFSLNHLVHRTFRIGEVILRGQALCEPCPNLADVTNHTLMVGLIHRGGLGARILQGGTITLGDKIEEVFVDKE